MWRGKEQKSNNNKQEEKINTQKVQKNVNFLFLI